MPMRLLFSSQKSASKIPIDKGDLCMALPVADQRLVTEPNKRYLATVVNSKQRKVIFFDDGAEQTQKVEMVSEATAADRAASRQVYLAALDECKRLAAMSADDVVDAAIESVKAQMGGTLGKDGAISYTATSGDETQEGRLLCEMLIGNFGALSQQSPALRWMSAHWQEVCAEVDVDHSGTISEAEAASIWAKISLSMSKMIAEKLDVLGAPPRLYRGDLCMARPLAQKVTQPDVRDGLHLASYIDQTHVTFFDGPDEISEVVQIENAVAADKEKAIITYTMCMSQCKAISRRPSMEVVKEAIEKVKAGMGGTLGPNSKIDYREDAGEQAKEGQMLLKALIENFAAVQGESRMVNWIASNWQAACAQADEDQNGTISIHEAVDIWDRVLIEMTRTFGTKLDKLGVSPIPLALEAGDFCMVKHSLRACS